MPAPPTVTNSATPPPSPADGDLWFNILTGRTYVWYIGPSGVGTWVETQPTGGAMPTARSVPNIVPQPPTTTPRDVTRAPEITVSPLPPAGPLVGDLWWSPITGMECVWYDDGNTMQWVQTQPVKYINLATLAGPAGGDLTGMYPDPQILPGVVLDAPQIRLLPDPSIDDLKLVPAEWVNQRLAGLTGLPIPPQSVAYGAPDGSLTGNAGLLSFDDVAKLLTVNGGNVAISTLPPGTNDNRGASTGFVAAAITALNLGNYAPLASPTFTGDPRAPTPAAADNDTSIATTQFVKTAIAAIPPPDLSAYAPLASPVFTGDPRAPTPAPGDNDTSIPTTAWVHAAIAAIPPSSSINVGDTPPVSPSPNALWWNSALGQMFIYYNDGSSTQWVPASPSLTTPPVLRGFIDGFQHTVAGGNQSFSVGGGMASDSTNAVMINRTGTLAKTMAPWVAGAGGSLDTGTVAANTWYHSYAIFNPTTNVVDHLTSLQPTNATPNGIPTLPAGFTFFRRVGAPLWTDGSSNLLGVIQIENRFTLKSYINHGGASSPVTVAVPPGLRMRALLVGFLQSPNNGTGGVLTFVDNGVTSSGQIVTANTPGTTTGMLTTIPYEVITSPTQQITFTGGGSIASYQIYSLGWIDSRGKDQ